MEGAPVRKKVLARECKLCSLQILVANWKKHSWEVEHIENEKHLERDVLVAGFPPDTKQRVICDLFSKYGPIEDLLKDGHKNKCMAVHFKHSKSTNQVLLKRHQLGRYELDVVARHPALLQTPFHSKELAWDEFLLNFLLTKRSLSHQLVLIANELRMTEEEQQQREVFREKLEQKFQEFIPSCRLVLFGPSVNGLGTKACDLDLFLHLNVPTGEKKMNVDMEKICENLELVRLAPDKSGFVTLISNLTMVEVVEVFSSILKKYVPACLDVVAQASARCPTIRFYSQGLQINCEISVNSLLALQNTTLIRFYNKLDERFQSLYFALHYWMAYHHLGNSKEGRLSKYALTMLTIFYLQSCDPPILPTVEELQKLEMDTDVQVITNEWEFRFCTDPKKVQRHDNQRGIGYLFANFFNFYHKHNLEDKVICLLTGKIKTKAEFKAEIEQRTDSNKFTKFKMGHLTVQDPFELIRNVTANVTEDMFNEWASTVKQAAARSTNTRYWTKGDPGNIWGFPFLLCGSLGKFTSADLSEVQRSSTETLNPFTVTISFKAGECCDYVVVGGNLGRSRAHAASCSRRVCRIVRDIFTRGYKFMLEDMPDNEVSNHEDSLAWLHRPARGRGRMQGKWRRLARGRFEMSQDQWLLDEYLIQTYYPVWWNRDEVREQMGEPPLDLIGIEGAITDVVKSMYRNFSTDVPVCECLCTMSSLLQPAGIGVLLKVEPLHLPGRNDWRKAFQEFIENDIPKLVRQVMSEQISTIAVVQVF